MLRFSTEVSEIMDLIVLFLSLNYNIGNGSLFVSLSFGIWLFLVSMVGVIECYLPIWVFEGLWNIFRLH